MKEQQSIPEYLKKEGIASVPRDRTHKNITFRPAETDEKTGSGFAYGNVRINTGQTYKEKTIRFGETDEKPPARPADFFRPKKLQPMDKTINFNQDIVV